ncbi:hypothetical protein OU798_07425 [Prolixibacteraceae bacterium Z1-6]|uniref:Uncharacterized protein n=1 Tax=Draconibacterium aestuarii TaxID=2998507 RepID=A0A9X3F5F2_9BACT|nr:hypothetical protein [Prolixibacteraceae bacterium Z1-6]
MKSFKKNYIGKGKEVKTKAGKKLDIVKVTLKMTEVLKHKHEYEGEEYITFEVAKMQKPDDFKRTHTAYVSTREEEN